MPPPNKNNQSNQNTNSSIIQQAMGVTSQQLQQLGNNVTININLMNKQAQAQKNLAKELLGTTNKVVKFGAAALAGVVSGRRGFFAGVAGGTAGGGAVGGATGAVIGGAVGAATGAFNTLLSVLEKLGQIAAAALPGGLDLISEAIQEVAASFGEYLAPVIPIVAAYIKTLGEILLESLAPALEKIPGILVDVMIPLLKFWMRVMLGLGSVLTVIIAGIIALGSALADMVATISWAVGATETAQSAEKASTSMMKFADSLGNAAGKMWNYAMDGDAVSKKFNTNLKDQSLRLSRKTSDAMGQPAFTGIADMWKKVQLEAFRNPHEVEMLKHNKAAAENTSKLVILNEQNNAATKNLKPFAGR